MTIAVHRGIDRTDLVLRYDFNNNSSYDSRQNWLLYSQDISNAAWTGSNTAIITDAAIAPDGTLTADKLNENTTNAQHFLFQTNFGATGVTSPWTFSAYLKAAERRYVVFDMSNLVDGDNGVVVDLVAGTIATPAPTAGGWNTTSSSILGVGSGWYKVSITGVTSVGYAAPRLFLQLDSSTQTYAGTAGYGIYMWGAQLVKSPDPLNYTQTTTSALNTTVTTINNLAISGTYNGTLNGGTYYRRAVNSTINSDVNIGSLQFRNSTGDYISAYTIPDSFWQNTWTVTMWVYLDEYSYTKGSDHAFVGHGTAGTTRKGLHLNERNGYAYFGLFGDDVAAPTPLTIRVWQCLTFSYDPRQGRRKIYINNRLDLDHIYAAAVYIGTGTNTEIGRSPWQNAYNLSGKLADVQFYNSMLTDAQLTNNFDMQRGRYNV